jgi:hypothetical protein
MTMSFLKRLILAICLLLLLGVPLSAMYHESAQYLPSQTDEDQPAQQDNGSAAGDETPGAAVPREPQEEQAG